MTDFSRLDAADRWLDQVCAWFRTVAVRAGVDNWSRAPEYCQARERSCRLLVRAVNRLDREQGALVRSGVPEGVVRAHVRGAARPRDRARSAASR